MIFQLVLNLKTKEQATEQLNKLDKEIKSCKGKIVGLETKSLTVEKNGQMKQLNLVGLLIDIPEKHSKQFMSYLKGNKISNKVKKSATKKETKKVEKKTTKKPTAKKENKKVDKKSTKKTIVKKTKSTKKPTVKKAEKDMKKLVKATKAVEKNMKKLEKKTKSKK